MAAVAGPQNPTSAVAPATNGTQQPNPMEEEDFIPPSIKVPPPEVKSTIFGFSHSYARRVIIVLFSYPSIYFDNFSNYIAVL
jgi:hypothetical protein